MRDLPWTIRAIGKFFSLTSEILDLPRHLGQHSGGMVVCQGQLDAIVPLEPASMPGRVVVQWDKDDCSDMKIVKVDLLGLGMMAVLQDCLDEIPRHYTNGVDLAHLPQNDPLVYGALQKADTIGWFQVESRAQMFLPAAHAAPLLLRHCHPGGDHPARSDSGRHAPSVSAQKTRD